MCNLRIDELAYRLVSNPWFDRVIITTIIINCFFLTLNDPTKDSNEQDGYLIVGDYIFSAIFIAELLTKWVALSIPTYFKDKWNWVDFVVVLESVVSLVLKAFRSPNSLDISALRGLRVLRPLRAITYIKQVKLLFETVISAFKVVNTLLLCVGCVMLFFGNVGYTYWADAFGHTCQDAVTFEILSENLVCGKGYACPDGYVCGDSGHVALNFGVTGYHDIWHAMLQAFQVVSLDGWQQVMWHTQDTAGEETWIFFVVLLVLGNVILVSMFPAVISSKLEAAIAYEEERRRRRVQAEQGIGEAKNAGAKKRVRASEFEMLLNEYSKIEADEIAAIERMAAVRRGEIREKLEEEEAPPPWTPFPRHPTLNRLRKAVLLELGPFSVLVYVVIFLNATVLCFDSADASDRTELVLSEFNKAFTSLFVAEMTFKLGLFGPVGYFGDGYNVFDFAITWLGLVEITIQAGGFVSGLRVIRIFRIARVFRLASLGKLGRKKFNASPQVDLPRMVAIITTSTPWIVNIYAVQLLLMFTFIVLGMQFFGGNLDDVEATTDNAIRFNYNSFGKAAVTLLDLLTGNLWSEIMFDTVGATGSQTGIIFYVVWLVLSRWLAVAMVVTVLFNRIDVDTEDFLKIAAKNSMRSVFALEHAFMQCHKSHAFLTWRKRYEEATQNRSSTRGQMKLLEYSPPAVEPGLWQKMVTSDKSLLLFAPRNRVREFCRWLTSSSLECLPSHSTGKWSANAADAAASNSAATVADRGFHSSGRGIGGRTSGWRAVNARATEASQTSPRGNQGCWGRFLGRRRPHRLARLAFDVARVLAVAATLTVVCHDAELSSGRRSSPANETDQIRVLEAVAVCIFLAETTILVVARGLILLPGAYLRKSSDVFDCFLTVLAAVCLWAFGGTGWAGTRSVSAVKAARALNVFRLLRYSRLSRSMTDLLNALRSSGKSLCLAGGVVVFFWLQWAIVGLQVWEGTFGFCSDPATADAHDEAVFYVYATDENGIKGQVECEAQGFEWRNASWNFDNFGNALQSVLIIFTYNGWQEIMFNAINASVSAEGLNAKSWHNTWAAIFFLFVLLISLVLVLLLVGVVFSMYTFINLTKRSGHRLSSLKQAFWTMYEAKLAKVQPDTVPACPDDAALLRRFLFRAVSSHRWDVALACLVGANVCVRFLLASDWLHYYDAPAWIHSQEAIFAVLYVLEWGCRAVAFGGVRAITRSNFQVADFLSTLVLVLVFIDEIIFLANPATSPSAFWKLVEAISMVRLIRLGHVLPSAQEFLLVSSKSSSVVFPLLLILAALTYLWSVFGVVFFGNETYLTGDLFGDGDAWEGVNRHQGFYGVGQGMQTMIGVATTPGSNGWITLMQRYEDVTSPRWRWAVLLFFGSYALLTRFLLVQFFMITLLFKYKTHSHDKVGIAIEQVNQFKQAWMSHAYKYTKEYTSIFAGQLVDLLKELPPPLGIGLEGSYYDCQILAKKVLGALRIDVVAHIPAQDLTSVLSLYDNAHRQGSRKPQLLGSGPGLIKLNFSKVLVAVHRIVLFDLTLEDERQVNDTRGKARENLSVLKLGVHRFLAMRTNRALATTRSQLEGVALAECSLLRTQLPATFMTRSSIALTAELLRWRDHVDLWGYDNEANLQGQCLLKAALHEISVTSALEKLTSRLFELHVGDRKLFTRLAEIRQHVVTLKELCAKLDAARGDYLQTSWDGTSLRVRQVIEDDERSPGVTGLCASMDGGWVFCTTDTGLLRVFKRGKPPREKRKKKKNRRQGTYALVQSMAIDKDTSKRSSGTALCVACSPDGFVVMTGCSDSEVRTFSQDSAGLRRAVQAMKAEGIRGPKPTVLYRPGPVGKGHKAAVRCATWLEPGYFYTGGDDGTVCMWRKSAATRPAQSVDVCRFTFSCEAVRCLKIWRMVYGIDLLAACIDVDDGQEVEPPVCLLVGDGEGYLSVLPARTDSKFFAIDLWEPSLRHQVDTGGQAVTAVEPAWGRVYTASGPSGVIKAWTPLWEDATKEKLLGFSQAGQYAVHSGQVSSILYTKGLMFSAGNDLSIVTWYPPVETGAVPASSTETPAFTPTLLEEEKEERQGRHHSGSTEEPSPERLPPPSPAAASTPKAHLPTHAVSPGRASTREAGTDQGGSVQARALHENDPGVVVHVAEVVGLALVPGGVVSADLAGKLLERGPDRLIESHRAQNLPGAEAIQRLRPLALEVLRARAHKKRPNAATAGPATAGSAAGSATGGAAALVPQASLDHICAVRFLLRAKAKRRVKEDIRVEKQKAADLKTATIFAARLGHGQHSAALGAGSKSTARPMLGADRLPRESAASDRSSLSDTFTRTRRHTIMSSVSMRLVGGRGGEGLSQEAADVSKIADMDQKPAFLDVAELEWLAKHPEVYLAQLMRHFFPGKDLAPPRFPGWHEAAASARAARAVAAGGTPDRRGKRFSLYDRVKPKGKGGVRSAQGRESSGGKTVAVKTPKFVSTADAERTAAMLLYARPGGHEDDPSGAVETGTVAVGAGNGERGIGAQRNTTSSTESGVRGDLLASGGVGVSQRSNLGQLLRRATRGEGEDADRGGAIENLGREEKTKETNEEEEKKAQEGKETGGGGHERGEEESEDGDREEDLENVETEERRRKRHPAPDAGRHHRKSLFGEAGVPASESRSSPSSRARRATQHVAAGPVMKQSNLGESADHSLLGDNLSTAQLRKQGSLTVYVPHSPKPGAWAASVDYDGERDVAWVLAEALRMYATEHRPVGRHAGLASRPRLVQRSPTLWGLFQGNSREWEEATALPLASSVRLALRPGQELVVLVDGFDPATAFTRRPSTVALPPTREVSPAAGTPGAKRGTSGDQSFSSSPLDYGEAGAPGRECTASDASRAPSGGARRFPVHGVTRSDTSVAQVGGADTCIRGGGFNRSDVIARGGRGGGGGGGGGGGHITASNSASGLAGAAERDWARISAVERDDEEEGGSDGNDSDDSLTEEEDEEIDEEYNGNLFPRQEPYGRSTGGDALLTRPSSSDKIPHGRDRAGGMADASVSTRGLAERCEGSDQASGGSHHPGEGAPGREQQGQQQAGRGFPQPRSPPRSLVSAMFTAWGDN